MPEPKPEPQPSLIDTILETFVPIHQDGQKFVGIAAVLALMGFVAWQPLGWLMVLVTAWVAYFFRDPPRVTPLRDGLVVSPADGRVCLIEKVRPPAEMGLGEAERVRVSIFLNVFDVHINRSPVPGTLKKSIYVPGKFVNAALDKASEDNERQHILIERGDGVMVGFTQIAGLVARRIVPFVKPGDILAVGQRVGLIRFGSRVDVYLPAGTEPKVLMGQKTIAGETILAEIGQQPLLEGVSQ